VSVPLSGSGGLKTVITVPGMLALEPSPSPSGRYLAWVGVTSTAPYRSTLFVTDLQTGTRIELGTFSGGNSDDGVAWSSDGRLLAVESGTTVVLADPTTPMSLLRARPVPVADGCTLTVPVFMPNSTNLAAIETCGTRSSSALAFDVSTGRVTALIASVPSGSRIESMSVDKSGQHVLLGVVPAALGHAQIDQVVDGALITVASSAPTAAVW